MSLATLLKVVLLESFKKLHDNLFKILTCKSCQSLKELDFSKLTQLEEIKDNSFQNSQFNSISFPNSLLTIGSNCFTNCNLLESLTIPILLTTFEESCFSGCTSLKTINLYSSFGNIVAFFNDSYIEYLNIYTNNEINLISLPTSLKTIQIMSSTKITFSTNIPNTIKNIQIYSEIINIVSFVENSNIPIIEIYSQNDEITIESLSLITTVIFQNPNNIKIKGDHAPSLNRIFLKLKY